MQQPPPPPLEFPYAFLLDLTVQPDFPLPTVLHPRASFSDGDGRSFAAIPLAPLPIFFADLALAPRLPSEWQQGTLLYRHSFFLPRPFIDCLSLSADRLGALFSQMWKEFTGNSTAYGESVKHIALPKDTVRNSHLSALPYLCVSDGISPPFRRSQHFALVSSSRSSCLAPSCALSFYSHLTITCC